MNDINTQQLLARMRDLSLQTEGRPQPPMETGQTDFSALLRQSIDAVNETQQTAGNMVTAFETGESEATLADVMIATQKAGIAFQAMVQVRNKLIDAYHDVMNMPM
ncbi:MAG: flagellar hook-basal body complex protein FliE [Gammaproteobacteria bacterium]